MSPTQKSLFLDSKFGNFILKQNEIPTPGKNQLLVKIEAVGLNPVDWKIQKYGIFVNNYPAIIGTDISGVVEGIGEAVIGFSKGDRVLYQGSRSPRNDKAGYQQYNLADPLTTAKIPPNLSFEEAASVPVAIAATFVGLYNMKPHGAGLTPPLEPSTQGLYAGKPFAILGGATSVGQYVIQFARLSGFSPIITTASLKHEEYLKSLGVTHVIDRHIPLSSLSSEVAKITTLPIETVYDAVSLKETQQAAYGLVAEGGQLVIVLAPEIKTSPGKDILHVVGIWNFPHAYELGCKLYSKLTGLLKEGEIRPNKVEVIVGGLNRVADGLERLKAGQVSGHKLIVRPQETA